ncbi:MAG TPA: response regulator [Noviherbaspirillum sp.]|nr:response regulator [Noviherbaspirillum sp.]
MSDVLTTGEAARICGVNFRTVIRWIDRGLLHAYKLPGRGDHRVPMEELRRFMRENGIPDPTAPVMPARRVLVTDDEPAMARAIERVLVQAKFETAIASNGFEAGAMLHTFRPGLITLDLRMPGVDGLGVLRFLRQTGLPGPLKVLVVSADTDDRLKQALALGADAVLRKPFSNEELLAAVERLYAEPPYKDGTGEG